MRFFYEIEGSDTKGAFRGAGERKISRKETSRAWKTVRAAPDRYSIKRLPLKHMDVHDSQRPTLSYS
jgi:hypothetical protein